MSADNLVHALSFQKMSGEVVWRVTELTMSGLPWELCHLMSTDARYRGFKEFSGKNARQQAVAAAIRLSRELPVCEYGVSFMSEGEPPLTFAALQQDAVDGGYDAEEVSALREASDAEMARKESRF